MFRALLFFLPSLAFAQEVSLVSFLQTAWNAGPAIKAEALQNRSSDQFVSAARGKYLPHLSVDAIDSTGFPASNSDLGVRGLMASPYRSGFSGGVVVEQTVYDFGRIQSALQSARAQRSLDQARLADQKFRYLILAGRIYLDCAYTRSRQDLDNELMKWARVNLTETAKFTRTGQRSIVDNSLVKAEVDNLQIELDQLGEYRRSLSGQMKLFGAAEGCQDLTSTKKIQVPAALMVEEPSVLLAKAQIEAAKAGVELAKADQLPKISVMGSAGYMDDARLINRQNYAAGVGLTFPIWNGGEDARREEAFKSQADSESENLNTAKLEYSARIKDLEDEFARQTAALKELEKNLETVEKTIRVASKRYQTLQGPLIDVREAIKQLRDMGGQHLQVEQRLAAVSLQLSLLHNLN